MSKNAIRSQAELGRIVDRSRKTISLWVRRDDWPFGKAPWSRDLLKSIQAWADQLPEDKSNGNNKPKEAPATEKQIKLELSREKLRKAQLDREIQEGEYIKRVDVEKRNVAAIQTVKTELMTLPRTLPTALDMVGRKQYPDVIEQAILEIFERFAANYA